MQKIFVFYWGVAHLAMVVLFLVFVCCYAYASRSRAEGAVIARLSSVRWRPVDAAIIAIAVAHCALYLSVPNFTDFAEPMIPLLANNYLHGEPVYSDWNAGHAVVGSLYGPYVFLAQIPILMWWPSIAASKLVGVTFSLGGLLLLFLAIRHRTRSSGHAMMMCALMVGLFSTELHKWFWNRPESILIAVVSLGALLFDRARPAVCLAGIGLLAGVALNLKVYAPVYLLPLALACVPLLRPWPGLIRAGAIGGVLFAAAAALPFTAGFSFVWLYLLNLSMMPNQGFDLAGCAESMSYGLVILALPLMMLPRRRIAPEDRMMAVGLGVCVVLVALIAGNPGGGPAYMMPLVPSALYLTARLWSRATVGRRDLTVICRLVSCAVLLCAAPLWAYSWFQISKQIPGHATEVAKQAELRALFGAYPGSEMGHNARDATEPDEFYRVEKAFLGQVTRFDYINYTDQRASGVAASVIYPLFEHCSVPTWILRRQGGRFLATTWDGGLRLMDDAAIERFYANYELAGEYRFYEVWRCKGASDITSTTEHSVN